MWEKQWARKFNTITLPEETQPGCNNQLKFVFFSNIVTTTVSEIMIHLSEKYNNLLMMTCLCHRHFCFLMLMFKKNLHGKEHP